jgi:anti-sigma-K factor RskA
MIDRARREQLMVRYLLGQMSADERADFETAYLNEDDVFQELVALENDLVDRYVLGDLSPAHRKQLEHSLQNNPARREAVETARSLLAHSAAAESELDIPGRSRYGWWRRPRGKAGAWAAAAIFFAMVGGIVGLVLMSRKQRVKTHELRREQSSEIED